MARKKSSRNLILLLVGLMLFIGILATQQQFTIVQEQVWIPSYFTGECIERAESSTLRNVPTHTDSATWYHCTTDEAGTWVPQHPGVQCEYQVSNFNSATIQICDGFTESEDDRDNREICTGDLTATFGDKQEFDVDAGDSIYINTQRLIGEANLDVRYPAYGLRLRSADGFVQSTTTSCLLNTVPGQYHTIGVKEQVEVKPDIPFNAVQGSTLAKTTQVVSLDEVEGGDPIYITRPGFYYPIEEADDGFLYVDTGADEKRNSAIECIPRTTGCSDDAKIVQLEEQSCDAFAGAITGYAPVQGDSTQLCKYSCSGGSLEKTSDCIEVPQECPDDKPLFDANTGMCVGTVDIEEPTEPIDFVLILITLGFIAIIVVMLVISQRQRGSSGGSLLG